MDDLGYTLSVAFSGADLTRAIWIAVIGALVTSKHLAPSKTTLLMIVVDRVWPFIGMALAGHEIQAVSAAVGHAITSIPADSMTIAVRGLVLFGVISAGYQIRLRIHGKRVELATAKRS